MIQRRAKNSNSVPFHPLTSRETLFPYSTFILVLLLKAQLVNVYSFPYLILIQ